MSAGSLRLAAGPVFRERPQPGYARSIALALGVHLLLVGVLFVGVRFQSSQPETVSVELWDVPAPPRAAEPPPPAPPKVEPKPEPPPPPKPEVKPEPKVEKPEIVEKAVPKPKPEPKPEPPKPKPKPKPEAKPKPPAVDPDFQRRMREELAQEQAANEDRQVRAQLAREQAAASSRALATWEGKIRQKIRSNIRSFVVDQVKDNPQAVFHVTLLPSAEVLNVTMVKSSGNKAYDEEVLRAIRASSPLPKPDPASLFRRDLELKFRPQDQ